MIFFYSYFVPICQLKVGDFKMKIMVIVVIAIFSTSFVRSIFKWLITASGRFFTCRRKHFFYFLVSMRRANVVSVSSVLHWFEPGLSLMYYLKLFDQNWKEWRIFEKLINTKYKSITSARYSLRPSSLVLILNAIFQNKSTSTVLSPQDMNPLPHGSDYMATTHALRALSTVSET